MDPFWDDTRAIGAITTEIQGEFNQLVVRLGSILPEPMRSQVSRYKTVQVKKFKDQSANLESKLKSLDKARRKGSDDKKIRKSQAEANTALAVVEGNGRSLATVLDDLNDDGVLACCETWFILVESSTKFREVLAPLHIDLGKRVSQLHSQEARIWTKYGANPTVYNEWNEKTRVLDDYSTVPGPVLRRETALAVRNQEPLYRSMRSINVSAESPPHSPTKWISETRRSSRGTRTKPRRTSPSYVYPSTYRSSDNLRRISEPAEKTITIYTYPSSQSANVPPENIGGDSPLPMPSYQRSYNLNSQSLLHVPSRVDASTEMGNRRVNSFNMPNDPVLASSWNHQYGLRSLSSSKSSYSDMNPTKYSPQYLTTNVQYNDSRDTVEIPVDRVWR